MLRCYERVVVMRVNRPRLNATYKKVVEFFLTDDDLFVKEMNYKKRIKFVENESPPISWELYKPHELYYRQIRG